MRNNFFRKIFFPGKIDMHNKFGSFTWNRLSVCKGKQILDKEPSIIIIIMIIIIIIIIIITVVFVVVLLASFSHQC